MVCMVQRKEILNSNPLRGMTLFYGDSKLGGPTLQNAAGWDNSTKHFTESHHFPEPHCGF